MRTPPFRAEFFLLLWTVACGGATGYVSSTPFPLGTPLEIDAALNAYLDVPAKEVTSVCNHTNCMSKRHELATERPYDTTVMVWTTNVTTHESDGKDKFAYATSKNSDGKSQDAPEASPKRVYLGGDQPDGCPEDIDTIHCDECGGNKGSLDGMSRCKGIADQNMQWEDCICVDMEFSHSDPLIRPRRGERMMSPYSLETLRLIEEYGSEEEDEPIDTEEGISDAEETGQPALQAVT